MKTIKPWLRLRRSQGLAHGDSQHRRSETGASAVEYGLLIAGIAAIIAVAIFAFGGGATGMFQDSCKTIFADRNVGSCS